MEDALKVAVIIPALDEEATIGKVVTDLREAVEQTPATECEVIVADNGSRDETGARARAAGARVVRAERRGYGSACLAALATLSPDTDVVLFADGDGADDPVDVVPLLEPLVNGEADLVIGSRALGERLGMAEAGALSPPQRLGNRLATVLIRLVYGVHFSDLGPFRAIKREALDELAMDDQDFGWTVQMQARAAKQRLRVRDVAVHYRRRRAGKSKVSGDLKGSVLAGSIILRTLAREALPSGRQRPRELGAGEAEAAAARRER